VPLKNKKKTNNNGKKKTHKQTKKKAIDHVLPSYAQLQTIELTHKSFNVVRSNTSSEIQGLLVETMRYFQRKSLLQDLKNFLLPNEFQKLAKSVPLIDIILANQRGGLAG